MKRIVFLVLIAIAVTMGAAAQSYTVLEVKGKVEREAGNQRLAIKTGDVLSADTVIYTGVGSSLVLKTGDRTFTVQAVRSGKVSELATASSGVRIGGNISHVDTGKVNRITGQVSTASARASDAAEDDDITAE